MRRSKRARLTLAGVGAVVAIAAFAPPAAVAHPCAGATMNEASSFLSLHTGGWSGIYPTYANEHECANEGGAAVTQFESAQSAGDPVGPATETFDRSPNLTPVGYSARVVPYTSGGINSDLAFQGKYAYQGTYTGFRVIDVSNPADPVQVVNYTGCTTGQGDVVVHKNILVRSWDSPVSAGGAATQSCGGQLVGQGFEGIHIFDITDPANPVFIRGLRFTTADNPDTGCGSHTATAVPDDARGNLYIYNGGSSGACPWMDVIKIEQANPNNASIVNRAMAGRQCHDNTVIVDGAKSRAVCAGGNGLSFFKFDTTIDPTAEGGIEKPTLMHSVPIQGVTIGHSGAFSYDGKTFVFAHEPGGGTNPRCRTTDSLVDRSLFFFDVESGQEITRLLHPRFQTQEENCTWHNFNTVPTKGANIIVSGNYQAGIYVVDFTDRTAPQVIAHADPAPLPKATAANGNQFDPDGGDWSTYWHNGKIYESDIYRGMMVWDLENTYTRRAKTFETSNPQTQIGVYEGDNAKPTINIAAPVAGGQFLQNSAQPASFTCADEGLGVESCVGTVANGANVDTGTIGYKTFTVTATDNAGNVTTQSVEYVVNSTSVDTSAGATVPATLALTLGTPATFGAFTPGVAREYTATTTANVISTAGDAALSVADPSSANTGKLVNGAFTLPSALTASAASAGGTAASGGAVGGSAAPTSLLTWNNPISNDGVTVTFKQAIGATDALRTGTYSKTLTFTLSTTAP
jgi:hypothetical protein